MVKSDRGGFETEGWFFAWGMLWVADFDIIGAGHSR